MTEHDDLNLQDAFSPMPEDCRQTLYAAVSSYKEEEPMMKSSRRAVLIAAALIILTMAVAMAAGNLGLIDFFKENYSNHGLPDSAVQVMSGTEQKTYEVGPLTMTLRETLADGRTLYITVHAEDKGGKSLINSRYGDLNNRLPAHLAAGLELPEETGFMDAAREKGLPYYMAAAYITLPDGVLSGEEMMGEMWQEDDSGILLVDMLMTDPDAMGEGIEGVLTLKVEQRDPQTGELMEGKTWRVDESISIPVSKLDEQKTYLPQGETSIGGYTLKRVLAERQITGIYLTAELEAKEGVKQENVHELYDLIEYVDDAGEALPGGINLSGGIESLDWPQIKVFTMVGLDALPDTLRLVNPDDGSLMTLK